MTWSDSINIIKTTYFPSDTFPDDKIKFLSTSPTDNIGYDIMNVNISDRVKNELDPNPTYELTPMSMSHEDGDVFCALKSTTNTNTPKIDEYNRFMNGLFAWYDICSAENWPRFLNESYYGMYPKWGYGPFFETTSGIIDKVMDSQTVKDNAHLFNPFVARRLLRIYIIMGNLAIVNACHSTANDSTKDAKNIDEFLRSINKRVTGADQTSEKIGQILQHKVAKYNSNELKINEIDSAVKAQKSSLSADQATLASKSRLHSVQTYMEYASVITFIMIASAGAGIVVYPGDAQQKYTGCGILVIAATINAIVLNALKSRYMTTEGFESLSPQPISYYVEDAKLQAVTYLENSRLLESQLQAYNAYRNLNQSMKKEINYFSDSSEQLLLADAKVTNASKTSYIQDVKFYALTNLLVSLSIIVAGVTSAYVASNIAGSASPVIQKYVLGFGGFFAFIALLIFILEVNSRVRTTPRQMYWLKPSLAK